MFIMVFRKYATCKKQIEVNNTGHTIQVILPFINIPKLTINAYLIYNW